MEDRLTPAFSIVGNPTALEGSLYAVTLGQPDNPSVTSYTIDWGDGVIQNVAEADLPANRQVEHVFADGPDSFLITVVANNDLGAPATPVATYEFDGVFTSSGAAAALSPVNAGQFITDTVFGQTRTVYQFNDESGLALSTFGLVSQTQYTIELVFRFDMPSGFNKVIDFANRLADEGLYVTDGQLPEGGLQFYPETAAIGGFPQDQYQRVVLTRSNDGHVAIYLSGTEIATFEDVSGFAAISSDEMLHFFLDDNGGGEMSGGRVALVRLYDSALSAEQIASIENESASQAVAVENVVPVVTAPADQTVGVNANATIDLGSFADPGADSPWSVSVDWGDSTGETSSTTEFQTNIAGLDLSAAHTYTQPGEYTVTVTVTDKDGALDEETFTVIVTGATNSVPLYTPPANQSGFQPGIAGSFDLGSFSDADLLDGPWSVSVAWGDNSSSPFDAVVQGSLGSLNHTYAAQGLYTVEVTITDGQGGVATGSFPVIVGTLVVNINDAGFGSLRDAIVNANAFAGHDVITFQIASGAQTIALASPLPALTQRATLDGSSQPGFAGSPLVTIQGGGQAGLTISAGRSIVRSLGFENFSGAALRIEGGNANQILGNRFGPGIAIAVHGATRNNVIGAAGAVNTFDNAAVVFHADTTAQVTAEALEGGSFRVKQDGGVAATLVGALDIQLAGAVQNVVVAGNAVNNAFTIHTSAVEVNGVQVSSSDADAWTVKGREGDDLFTVVGASAPFTLEGNVGNDTFRFLEGASITGQVQGGVGTNVLDYSARTSAVAVDLATGSASSTGGITGIQHVIGGSGGDHLIGRGNGNILDGRGGNDYLSGAGGADILRGGAGDDVLVGGGGNDQLFGEAGRDLLIGGDGADSLDGGADDDILLAGRTTFEGNIAAVDAVMAIWTNTGMSYNARVNALTSGANALLSTKTVKEDNDGDTLWGRGGDDLFGVGQMDVPMDWNAAIEQIIQFRR